MASTNVKSQKIKKFL